MGAFHKQLKIWRDDFLKYYGRTSLVARIVIGAALGFGIAWGGLTYVIRPETAKIKEINKKLDNMTIIADSGLMMQDLKNRQRRVSVQLKAIQEENRVHGERNGGLSRAEIGRTLFELRRMMDSNRLRIVSESRVIPSPPVRVPRKNAKSLLPDTKIKVVLPETMACDTYAFRVLGSFGDIRGFLHAAYAADPVFFLNNIAIKTSDELMTDRGFRQYKALECSFELHIPYLKGN